MLMHRWDREVSPGDRLWIHSDTYLEPESQKTVQKPLTFLCSRFVINGQKERLLKNKNYGALMGDISDSLHT
jgi:hypothetical protein